MLPRCSDIKRDVPISKINEGVAFCKRNIVDYIKDARLIIKDGRPYHAVINVEFALEEFGKALLIIKAKQNSPTNKVDINGKKKGNFVEFCDHNRKVDRALALIDPTDDYRTIFRMAEKGCFEKGILDEPEINHETRLECSFVEYKNNKWNLRTSIDEQLLNTFIDHLELEVNKIA